MIADDIGTLRTFMACQHGQIVHECWAPHPHEQFALDGPIERVLDEIERPEARLDGRVGVRPSNETPRNIVLPASGEGSAMSGPFDGIERRIANLEEIIRDQLATIAALNEENRWRDPEVERPALPFGRTVLVAHHSPYGATMSFGWDTPHGWHVKSDDDISSGDVIGWRPLPAPSVLP